MTDILFIGVSIALFSVLLTWCKRPNQISDKIFIAFLLLSSVPIIPFLLLNHPSDVPIGGYIPALLSRFGDFMPLTLGPFMTLYVESLTIPDFVLTKRRMIHFLPFSVFLIIASSFPQRTVFFVNAHIPGRVNLYEACFVVVLLLSFISYSVWLQIALKKHRKMVLDNFSQNSSRISLMWLVWVVYLFFIVFVLAHIPPSLRALDLFPFTHPYYAVIDTVHHVSFILFLVVMSFFGVRQSQFRYEHPAGSERRIILDKPIDGAGDNDEMKDSSLTLRDDQLESYLVTLDAYVKAEKPYLDSDLTLDKLALMTEIPKHHLTQVLNRKLHKNFYNYINGYRLEELKPLLLDPQHATSTIQALAYQVGFNSKSTFNTFFKKTLQMTPSQFRKNLPNKK